MDFEPGDIQFLKNSAILHCQSEYEGFDDPDLYCHLLQLWLAAYEFEGGDASLRQGLVGVVRNSWKDHNPYKDGASTDGVRPDFNPATPARPSNPAICAPAYPSGVFEATLNVAL
jgi:hypothetical protein